MKAGEALAEAILAYLSSRVGESNRSVRILVVDFPTDVQMEAARSLVRRSAHVDAGLQVQTESGEVVYELALIQDPAEVLADRLVTEGDYMIGTSPDFPVALRNRRGNVVLFCPPHLFELCHESIKSNTFQRFERNRRFGHPATVLQRLRFANGFPADSDSLSFVADEKLARDLRRSGQAGWTESWAAIDLCFHSESPDLRLLGILPARELSLEPNGDSRSAAELRAAVRRNIAFQSKLVEGLATAQAQYLEREFGERASFEDLVAYLARFHFRLRHDDPSWRRQWPTDLLIDDLARARPSVRALTILGLDAIGSTSLNGLRIVRGTEVEVSWRARGGTETEIDIYLNDVPVETVPVRQGSARLTLDGSGTYRIRLVGTELPLRGETELLVLLPPEDGALVVSIDEAVPGASRYAIGPNSPFRVRWWVVKADPPRRVDVYLASGGGDLTDGSAIDDLFQTVEGDESWVLIEEGIEFPADLLVAATLPSGRTLEAEARVDIEESDTAPTSVGTVAQAILHLAGQPSTRVEWNQASAVPDVRVSQTQEGFHLTFEWENAATSGQYRLLVTELLDAAETEFLRNPEIPWPRAALRSAATRGAKWSIEPLEPSLIPVVPNEAQAEHEEFVESRRELFKRLTDFGRIGAAELVEIPDSIERYAQAYCNLLEVVARDGRPVDRYASFVSMVDTILVEYQQGRGPKALLMSPTHPLRLSWLAGFEQWIREILASGQPFSTTLLGAMDSTRFPSHLVDESLHHFRSATTAASGTWLVLVPEDITEVDKILPAQLSRFLLLDSPSEGMAVSSDQLAAAIDQYHALHPFKDVLRIAYLGVGTAERLREAIERLITRKPKPGLRGVTGSRLRFELELLDLARSRSGYDLSTGQAFGDYAEGEPNPEVLERSTFAVRHLETSEFLDPTRYTPDRIHLIFGSELFARDGRSEPLGLPIQPMCRGLAIRGERILEFADNPRFRLLSSVPSPPADSSGLAGYLHRMIFAVQSLSAATPDRPSATDTEARGIVVNLGPDEQRALNRMHELAEWVYLLDANVDVEYFDNPSLRDRYVLDYVPSFVSATRSGRPHSYIITSEDDALIRFAINLFLQPAYLGPGAGTQYERAPSIVRDALNRVSGRQVFRLVGEPSWAKGAVGIALTALAYRMAGLPEGAIEERAFSMIILIPIDDYIEPWRADAADIGFQSSKHHADLIALGVTLTDEGVQLDPIVIEVKNQRRSYSYGDLVSGPFLQVERTARLVEAALGIGDPIARGDRELKFLELAELIDYHVRRSAMQRWGDDVDALAASAEFRRRVFSAIASGQYKTSWPTRSGFPFWGLVLHFNPGDPSGGGPRGLRELIGDGGYGLYASFGLEDVRRLLSEAAPEGLASFGQWLDPRAGESPTPASEDVPEPGDTGPRGGGARSPEPSVQAAPTSPALQRANAAFAGFVGNDAAKQRLIPWLASALQQDPHRLPENIAFTGPPSTGKTELGRRVAQALNLPFVGVSGSALASLDDLINRMEREAIDQNRPPHTEGRQGGLPILKFPPMVVFIDEAHEIRRPVQEELLTLLEPSTRRGAGSRVVADVENVTFIIATTDWGDLIGTLQSRFQRVSLRSYSEEEVAEIVRRQFPEWSEAVCRRLAIAGRLLPRQALQRAREYGNGLDMFSSQSPEKTLAFYFELWEINDRGLTRTDLEYLGVLDESTGAVGLARLSARLGLGQKEIERNVEPFLQQLGLVEVTTQGRALASEGKRYLRSL